MLLLDNKPINRTFPSEFRYKIEFESNNASSVIPPLYVYIDNSNRWNIDTFWMLPALRAQIREMFETLYSAHFDVLTVEKLIEAANDADAIKTQFAHLDGDADEPFISVCYSDQEITYPIPGRRVRISKIHCKDILNDITKRRR